MRLLSGAIAAISVCQPAAMWAQAGSAGTGNYSGPSVLSRWSRMPGGGTGGHGPTIRVYFTGTYAYLDGLTGPVTDFNLIPGTSDTPTTPALTPGEAVHTGLGAGGLSINRVDKRSQLTLGYQASYSRAFSKSSNVYQGLNQDLNLNYERQLSRRWGFYTGHTAGTQSSVLGLARQTEQRNFFDQSYSAANEALDARLNYLNSGGGFYYQKSARLTFSMDAGVFSVSRRSRSLASSRGERAQGEIAYRTSRRQSIGVIYSFSHFFFPRGFGETYTSSVMAALTHQFGRQWVAQFAVGPYRSESERLTTLAVDPFIASLTGQSSTLTVFHGIKEGIGGSATISTQRARHNFSASARRGVDPGNGLTLSSVNDYGQATWGYQGGRTWAVGASVFASRLRPLLEGVERRSDFRSYGSQMSFSYRITGAVHAVANFGLQSIEYDLINVTQVRRSFSVGLGFSPGEFPLVR